MKVALACPGVGQVQRGYERFFTDLYRHINRDVDVTLFKGGGETSANERVLWFARRTGKFCKYVPLHALARRTPYHTESLTFALALMRHLWAGKYDLVHCVDPPLLRMICKMRGVLGGNFKILFSHAGALPFDYWSSADHVHHIAPGPYNDDLAAGRSTDRVSLLPIGVDAARFRTNLDRSALRAKHGIGEKTFVILSIAAVNRLHKRVDYLINEVAKLDGDVMLWVDGSMDPDGDPTLLDLAKEKLGDRCRFTHVPTEQLGELFALADVKVLASLVEAFGLAPVEAMTCGLPALVHDNPHFRWLVGSNQQALLDMTGEGNLAAKLAAVMKYPVAFGNALDAGEVRRRFAWGSLKDDYVHLYRRLCRGTAPVTNDALVMGDISLVPSPGTPGEG